MNDRRDTDGRKEDELMLQMGDLIRQELPRTDVSSSKWMHRGWKPAPGKIAALAGAAILVAGGAILAAGGLGRHGSGRGVPPVAVDREHGTVLEKAVAGRVSLAEGDIVVVRGQERRALRVGDEIVAGDTVEAAPGSAVGIRYEGGPTILLDEGGRLEVASSQAGSLRIDLLDGMVAVRTGAGWPLSVRGANAEVRVDAAVAAVRAESGRIVTAMASEGGVEVVRSDGGRSFEVGRSQLLDLRTWTTTDGVQAPAIVGRLALVAGETAAAVPAKEPEELDQQTEKTTSLIVRIQKALEAGDVDAAIALIEKSGKGQSGTRFNLIAGEAYRQAGMWPEAAEAYLAAAESGQGQQAERAFLRAASILYRKMGKTGEAARVLDDYLERFPSGTLLDEALYLGGVVHAKSGNSKRSRELFERYLSTFPSGPQAARVHLTLAKLLAMKLSDCASAVDHVEAVVKKAPGSHMAEEASKIAVYCKKGEPKEGK
jgi:TolA-binding protein